MTKITKIKQEAWDILKRNFAIILIGTVFLVGYFNGCGGGKGNGTLIATDTASKTTQVLQPIVINPPYTPQQVGQPIYVNLPKTAQGVIPASTMEGLIAQVKDLSERIEALGKQYYAIKNYEDSIQLKDTAGKRVGVVNLKQVVSQNTLQSTQPSYQLSFPHTTTVITNTVAAKARNQLFAGMGFSSFVNKPQISQVDLGLLLKNKKDNVLGISGTYDFPNKSPGVRLNYYQKISFRSRIP